ncbi:hypothetical protein MMC11_004884 [Xylographa trunciseda]|nr:hypothetical protein [Xylographa trunciseda]
MSLINDQSLYSGLTSRPTRSITSTRSRDNGSTGVKITLKNSAPYIKAESPAICELGLLASLDNVLGENIPSFSCNSWDNVSFFDNDTSAAAGVLSRSCNSGLEKSIPQTPSPEISQRALHSVRSIKKLAQNDSSRTKTHACSDAASLRSERSGSHSSGSSSPILHDEGDGFFETPKASTGLSDYQLTPPTPVSAYGTQYFPLEEDSGSPVRSRRQRPAPSPVQPSKEEADIPCRGRTELQPTVQDETRLRDTSAQSWVSVDRLREESTSGRREGKTFVQLKPETKTEGGTANRYDILKDASFPSLGTLVKGTDVLEDIFGFNILSRLEADPKICVENLKQPKAGRVRCSRRLNLGHDKIARIHMDELQSLLSLPDVATKLVALVPLIFCGRVHRDGANKRVATWRLDNQGADLVRDVCHDLPRDHIGNLKDITGSCSLVDKSRVVKDQDIIPPQIKKDVIRSFPIDLDFDCLLSTTNPLKPSNYKTTIKQFIPWQPLNLKKVDVKTALLKSINHPLRKQGDIPGYLYVYATVGDFGARKIGVTARDDIQERMGEWLNKCKRRINLIYPLGNEKVSVPHVYRLEKLVHTELKEYRFGESGCGCGVQRHEEWFHAKDHHITEVVRRWTEWLLKAPYEKSKGEWVLKKEFQELDEICTLYEPLEAELALKGEIESQKRVAVTRRLTQPRRSSRIARLHPRRSARIAAAER